MDELRSMVDLKITDSNHTLLQQLQEGVAEYVENSVRDFVPEHFWNT